MSCDEADEADEATEVTRVLAWRELEALAVGLAPQEAEVFALSDGDLGKLRRLVENGCPADVAFLIVT